MPDLDTVLADAREEAGVLRRAGHGAQADWIEGLCAKVADASEEYRKWLSEEDALLRSGKRRGWFRARFAEWERSGNARMNGRKREYRMVIVPQGANTLSARDEGRRAGAGRAVA